MGYILLTSSNKTNDNSMVSWQMKNDISGDNTCELSVWKKHMHFM